MDEFSDIKRGLENLSYQAASVREELKFHKLMRALKGEFDPEQIRDDRGRWSSDGSTEVGDNSDTQLPLTIMAARRTFSLAECEAQYKSDTFQCTMVGSPSCHRQAAQRYAACLGGTQIPALNY